MTPIWLGLRVLSLSPPFTGMECTILVSAEPLAAAQFSGRLFHRVTVVMICRTGVFHPRGQKPQIKKIRRLDGRSAHTFIYSNSKRKQPRTPSAFQLTFHVRVTHVLPLLPKLIDILFNSFTCDAVPGLSPALRDRTLIPARLIQTEQILWRKNRSKRRS